MIENSNRKRKKLEIVQWDLPTTVAYANGTSLLPTTGLKQHCIAILKLLRILLTVDTEHFKHIAKVLWIENFPFTIKYLPFIIFYFVRQIIRTMFPFKLRIYVLHCFIDNIMDYGFT